jgi:hypothetical protein
LGHISSIDRYSIYSRSPPMKKPPGGGFSIS